EPWLAPDVNDALRALAADGARDVVVVPVGFVCDHVEVLYDLDVAARATARAAGLGVARASTVNDHPLFIQMLAEVVAAAAWPRASRWWAAAWPGSPRRTGWSSAARATSCSWKRATGSAGRSRPSGGAGSRSRRARTPS